MPTGLTRVHVALLLTAILGLGLSLRLTRWSEERSSPLGRAPLGDEGSYDRWGQALSGGEHPRGAPYMAPLPAYVLAVAHHHLSPGQARDAYRLGAIALGLLSIALAFLCGRELSGDAVGLVAAFLVATHRMLIYYEPTLLRDGPAAALLGLAAWALLRRERASPRGAVGLALVAGLALGVGALVRENLFLVGVVAVLGLGVHALSQAGSSRRTALLASAVLGLGLLAPATPWLLGNMQEEGRLSPFVTWNGGCVFYLHNRVGNLSSAYRAPAFVLKHGANPEGEQKGFRREAERRTGRALTPHEVSSYWLREGLREVTSAPGLYLLKLTGRLRTLLVSESGPHARDMRLDATGSRVLGIPSVGFGFLVAFALLGALLGGGAARRLALVIAAAVLLTLPVAFLSRYRLIVVPLVACLAASGLARGAWGLREWTRLGSDSWAPDQRTLAIALSRRGASVRAAVGLFVALVLGLALHTLPAGLYQDTSGRLNRALAQLQLREPAQAVETLRACEYPTEVTWALLGRAGALAGQWADAELGYHQLVLIAPGRIDGWLGLTLALGRQGRRREALQALARAKAIDPAEPLVRTLERALR